MIDVEYIVTVFNYLAQGVFIAVPVVGENSVGFSPSIDPFETVLRAPAYRPPFTPAYIPYQLIAIVRSNGVAVSRFTITNIAFSDRLINQQNEQIVVTLIGTDASNYSYTATCVEIWASTQNALLYKIATIVLTSPISKSELDYLQIEYKITICAGSAFMLTPQLRRQISQCAFIALLAFPTAPILFFFGLFLVPNFITILKQNPTYPLSQLLAYFNFNSFPSFNTVINRVCVNGNPAEIISKLVGFGEGQANLVVNFKVFSSSTNPFVVIGIFTQNGFVPIAYGLYSGTISQYGSFEISAPYGSSTVKYFTQTKTTGG